jgi:hypothetical protein
MFVFRIFLARESDSQLANSFKTLCLCLWKANLYKDVLLLLLLFFFLSPMLISSLVLQQMCRYHHSHYHSSRGLWRQYFGIALSMTPPRSSQPQNTMRWKGALQANSSSCSDAIGRAPSKTLELLKCALMLHLKIWNIDMEQCRGGNMLTSRPQRRYFPPSRRLKLKPMIYFRLLLSPYNGVSSNF